MEEKMQVKVIERTQDIQIQEQEIVRKEKELEATIKKPAEAERYRLEKLAEANKQKIIMEAEAESEAIRLRGEAEAHAIQVRAKAEAETMARMADAFKQYDQAAKVEMILRTLPKVCLIRWCAKRFVSCVIFLVVKVAAEVAHPLSQCNKVVMVSNSNEVGAARITGEVLDIVTKIHANVASLIGASGAGQAASSSVGTCSSN